MSRFGPLSEVVGPSTKPSLPILFIYMEEEAEQPKMSLLDGMSQTVQFGVLASGVFLFFGLHNFLQEAIMNIPGYHFGVMLGFLEVLG